MGCSLDVLLAATLDEGDGVTLAADVWHDEDPVPGFWGGVFVVVLTA